MESQAATQESLISRAFEQSHGCAVDGGDQVIVIPQACEEVVVANTDSEAMDESETVAIANQFIAQNITTVKGESEEEQSSGFVFANTCSAGEFAAASSIMAIKHASQSAKAPLTFEVMESGSQRGSAKLVDSNGYCYTLRRIGDRKRNRRKRGKSRNLTYWRCAVRGKQYRCGAAVVQEGEYNFIRNPVPHGHQPKPCAVQQVKIRKEVKMLASANIQESGPSLVNKVLLDHAEGDELECNRVVHSNLVRTANRIREKMKDKVEPKLDEVLDNVHEYFKNEERAGGCSNVKNPMKRLSVATGIPVRTLKKRFNYESTKEVAIKRCVGGEITSESVDKDKGYADIIDEIIENVVDDFEEKDQTFSMLDLKMEVTKRHPELPIARSTIGRVLRKLGYQASRCREKMLIETLELEKKAKKTNVIKLVRPSTMTS